MTRTSFSSERKSPNSDNRINVQNVPKGAAAIIGHEARIQLRIVIAIKTRPYEAKASAKLMRSTPACWRREASIITTRTRL